MKKMYEIYYKMTENAQDAADCIDDEVSALNEKSATRECIVKEILQILDNWEPELKPNERKRILEYVKAEYGISM